MLHLGQAYQDHLVLFHCSIINVGGCERKKTPALRSTWACNMQCRRGCRPSQARPCWGLINHCTTRRSRKQRLFVFWCPPSTSFSLPANVDRVLPEQCTPSPIHCARVLLQGSALQMEALMSMNDMVHYDSPLTDVGRREATALGGSRNRPNADVVVASSLQRSMQTAELVRCSSFVLLF